MIRTYLDDMQLPVNPLEDLTFSVSANNQRFEIVAIGEVTKIGSRNLMKVDIKSLFTDGDYPFVTGSEMSAEKYVNKIRSMMNERQPVRFIVTGDGVDINMRCSIETFKPSKPFGEWEDYYYTLSLLEYRAYSAKRLTIVPATTMAQVTTKETREEKAASTTSHTVVSGDCLWAIAQKYYGNGSQYTKIYEANKDKISNPNLIYPGQVLVIP